MALILHPLRRTEWIRQKWPAERANKALHSAQLLWERYRDAPSRYASERLSYDIAIHGKEQEKENEIKKPRRLNKFQELREKRKEEACRSEIKDEYMEYCTEPSYDPKVHALEWWLQDVQQKRFPRLSSLALEVLSIPAMSAEIERIFSGGRRTMRWDRARLSVQTLEWLECQKNWAKQDFSVLSDC